MPRTCSGSAGRPLCKEVSPDPFQKTLGFGYRVGPQKAPPGTRHVAFFGKVREPFFARKGSRK